MLKNDATWKRKTISLEFAGHMDVILNHGRWNMVLRLSSDTVLGEGIIWGKRLSAEPLRVSN